MLRIELLGGFSVLVDGAPRPVPHKLAELVAWLACHGPAPSPREVVIEAVWPEREPGAGRNSLRNALSRLRRLLEGGREKGSVIAVTRDAVGLAAGGSSSDVADLEDAISRIAVAGSPEARLAAHERVVALHRGELLPEHYAAWVLERRARYLAQCLRSIHALVDAGLAAGVGPGALDALARRAVELDPLSEVAARDLIRVEIARGDPASARRTFEALARRLDRDLGIPPDPATRVLVDAPPRDARPDAPARRGRPGPAIPPPPTRFVGRAAELARIERVALEGACRVLTLTGPAGIGKTRLAHEAARRLDKALPLGAHLVDLSALESGDDLVRHAAAALELTGDDPHAALQAALEGAPSLVVLDHAAPLLDRGVREGLLSLLAAAPDASYLVTSRHPLGVEGERELPVPPLPVSDGALLYLDRARGVAPDLEPEQGDDRAIEALVERLSGLPLAIELAAGRARTLGPRQLLARLEGGERLLRRSSGSTARHVALEDAIADSVEPLSADARRLLAELTVFAAELTVDAVEAVASTASPLDDLDALCAWSLVQLGAWRDGARRLRLLAPIRDFAARELDDGARAAARLRLARFLTHLAGARPLQGVGREAFASSLRELARWQADALSLLPLVAEDDPKAGLDLASAWTTFWHLAGAGAEGLAALEVAIGAAERDPDAVPPADLARARSRAGFLAGSRGELARATSHLEGSVALLRSSVGAARALGLALRNLGAVYGVAGDAQAAERALEEALATFAAPEDAALRASCLGALGQHRLQMGALAEAREALEEAIAISRAGEGGDAASVRRGGELRALALVRHLQGDGGDARALADQALELASAMDAPAEQAQSHLTRARIAMDLGDDAEADLDAVDALPGGVAGPVGRAQVQHLRARGLARRGERFEARVLCQRALAALRGAGNRPGIREAVVLLGDLTREEGATSRASALYEEALAETALHGDRLTACGLLERVALLLAGGARDLAADLLASAAALREELGAPRLPVEARALAPLAELSGTPAPFAEACERALSALGELG